MLSLWKGVGMHRGCEDIISHHYIVSSCDCLKCFPKSLPNDNITLETKLKRLASHHGLPKTFKEILEICYKIKTIVDAVEYFL